MQLWPEAEPRWLSEGQGTGAEPIPTPGIPWAHSRGSVLPALHNAGLAAAGGHGDGGAVADRTILTARHSPGWLSQQTHAAGPRAPHPPVPPFSPQPAPARTCGAANLPLPAGAGARGRAGRAGPRFLLPVLSLSMSRTGKSPPFPEGSSKPSLGRWALWLLRGHLHRW